MRYNFFYNLAEPEKDEKRRRSRSRSRSTMRHNFFYNLAEPEKDEKQLSDTIEGNTEAEDDRKDMKKELEEMKRQTQNTSMERRVSKYNHSWIKLY